MCIHFRYVARSLRAVSIACCALAATWSQAADEAKPADEGPKITYAEHIQPILREHCLICHNQNETKGGLALDNYAAVMEGGSSGEVVFAGDLDSSRLWALVNRDEQPYMPPNQDRIADAKLDLLKRWIEQGALQDVGSKVAVKKKATLALSGPVSTGRPEAPAMPEGLWKQPVVYTSHPGAVTALAASPWAPLVAVAGQKQVALYHADNGQLLGILPFPEGVPYVVRFSRDGSLLLAAGGRGAHSGCAVLFDVKTGRRMAKVGDELDAVLAADVSPDLARIALSGPQRLIRIYATDTGEKVHEIKKHTDWVYAIAYSPDGVLLATADRANGLFVWEADTARQYLDLRGHTGAVSGLAWRPDSNVLASCSNDGTVKLWEMVEGKNVKNWNAHGGGVQRVEYTHDGRLATVGRDNTAKLWDGEGKQLRQFPGFPEPALRVAFTRDGNRVVAGDWSGQVQMWEAADGKVVCSLAPNPPTLAMIVEAAQAKFNAAQAAAQQAQAELATIQTAATEKAASVQATAAQAESAATAAQQADAARQAAEQAVQTAANALKTATEALATARTANTQAAQAATKAAKLLEEKTATAKAAADKVAQSAAEDQGPAKQAAEAAEAERSQAAEAASQQAAAAKQATDAMNGAAAALQQAQVAKQSADRDLTAKTAAAKAAADRVKVHKTNAERMAAEKAEMEKQLAAKQEPAAAAQKELDAAKTERDQAVADKTAFDQAAAKARQAEPAAPEGGDLEAAEQAAADRQAFLDAYGQGM